MSPKAEVPNSSTRSKLGSRPLSTPPRFTMALNDLSAIIEMPVAVHEQCTNGTALSRGNHTTDKKAYIVTADEIIADHHETTSAAIESRRKLSKLSDAVSVILQTVGEDPSREGLLQTPERFAKAMMFFTKGYAEDPAQILRGAIFHEKHRGLVLVKNIEFSSLCEHHLVPFIGKVKQHTHQLQIAVVGTIVHFFYRFT